MGENPRQAPSFRSVSRRDFLGKSAAAVLGLAYGCRAEPTRRPCSPVDTDDSMAGPVHRDFDLIVVGSGFAGAYLGSRAVQNQIPTLIIEAGGDVPGSGPIAESFGFENKGAIDYPVNRTRQICVGGTSNHWGGVISRPFPNDFRMRSEYGILSDWPISYADVEDYLCAAESLLHVRGAPFVRGEPPRDCPYPKEYRSRPPDIRVDGEIPSYVPVARSRETEEDAVRLTRNVIPRFEASRYSTLLKREQVRRLVTLDGRRIDHVETFREDGTVGRYGARWFVVAAGVIETPRLLLLSGNRHQPGGLGNAGGLVGRHLSLHPSFSTSFVPEALLAEPGEYRAFEPIEAMRREGIGGYHLHLVVDREGRITWRVQPEMESRADNRITLSNDWCDVSGSSLPELHLSFSDRDMRTLERVRDFIRQTKTSLAARVDSVRDWERWRAHPSGSCRMGSSPETGVVDRDNRVFGLENLYLSGAATFTTAGTANPTNLIVALTLRLADHLERRNAEEE